MSDRPTDSTTAAAGASAAIAAAATRAAESTAQQGQDVRGLIDQIHALRHLPPGARDWARFSDLVRQLCRARAALLVAWEPQPHILGQAGAVERWQPAQEMAFGDIHQRALRNGHAYGPSVNADGRPYLLVVVRVSGLGQSLLILYLDEPQRGMANELVLRAMLAADFTEGGGSAAAGAAPVPGALADMIDLSAEVMAQGSFPTAALALVNGVTVKLPVTYAALGWVDAGSVRTAAISQLDRFDRKSQQVQQLEQIFERVRLEDRELWENGNPTPDAVRELQPVEPSASPLPDAAAAPSGEQPYGWSGGVDSPLAAFVAERGYGQVCALPVRDTRGALHAVLLCAFDESVTAQPDVNPLLLALDLMQPRLADLFWREQNVLRRSRAGIRAGAVKLFGPEHAMAKLIGVLVLAALAYICLGSWAYRVDANAQLVTDSTRLISAQFDGRIEAVNATAGDLVKEGAVLLQLDVREQRQQEVELQAEIRRAQAEVAKFRANENLSEMEIAQARLEQSQARIARVQQFITQATATAPFDGVVVEGERRDLLGSPAKKGEMLMRVAKVEGLYGTLMVPERDIREVTANARGTMMLLSHPDMAIPFQVTSIIPVAQVKGQEGNHFMLTAKLDQAPEAWWRPGMTGLAKIDAGERRIIWIWTHKLIDNIRMYFWW